MNHEMPKGTPATPLPSNRYILPQFEERTPYGFKRQDPYAYLFEDRIIFLGTQVDDASADDIMAQLLVLEAMDSDREIGRASCRERGEMCGGGRAVKKGRREGG